ncbi:unnamed protein product [Rotaria magnacalcarata]|uniref:Peptidase C1A papain C-terminal domain-containing protein n=1 Tax=Rotaria magnacalcarata TaxID=392030 RepID=A0A815HMF7_9BILA|nr:unnamed protein product [Rotaria magnacalcarata]CAF3855049.1 unnamed protein product [Rotaria magnacalcarata]
MKYFNFEHENRKAADENDEISRVMRPISFPKHRLSRSVDLRPWMTHIAYQGDMNTCCANAFAGICEYLIKRAIRRDIDISRLFIYYNGQIIGQKTHNVRDDGVYQRDIALGLRKYGLCQENTWRYEVYNLNKEPSTIEICLHNQIPVLIDIILIDQARRNIQINPGYLSVPSENNALINQSYFHTVVLVGYNRDKKYFIGRNSWGTGWGHEGYFYLPYDYLNDNRLVNSTDGLWTILKIIRRKSKLPTLRQFALTSYQ